MVRRAMGALLCLVNGLLIAVHGVADPLHDSARHAVILQYHHVSDHTPASTSVQTGAFRQHLDILRDNGFHVLPLPTVVAALRNGEPLPDRTVVITFDDAYIDIYDTAAPLLQEYGFPFTVFVSTDYVDRAQRGYMDWDQLRQLQQQGATLANHTRSHPHLLRQPPEQTEQQWLAFLEHEINGAEQRIRQETGEDWRYFAYPYGEANERLIQLLKAWGYIGFGQVSGAVDKTLLESGLAPRFPFNRSYQAPQQFKLKAASKPLPILSENYPGMVFQGAVKPELILRLATSQGGLSCFASGQGAIAVQALPDASYRVQANEPIPVGRSRYNCTLPVVGEPGRFYWYSRVWIRREDDGSWYPES